MIYYVEDDRNIRELVVYALCSSGLAAEGFAEAGEFWEALRQEKPELVLLDIMLPGQDGVSILKELRENAATADLPVLMLTAKGSVSSSTARASTTQAWSFKANRARGRRSACASPCGRNPNRKTVFRKKEAGNSRLLCFCGVFGGNAVY